MFYIQPSEDEIARALDAWRWLPIATKKPVLVTAFGDIFFTGDGGVWFLDRLEGQLKKVCNTEQELQGILRTVQGESDYLLAGFVERAHREGMTLGKGQCYDFALNPVVGGKIVYGNIQPQDFVVAVHIAGQLYEQIKSFPDGARITKFVYEDNTAPNAEQGGCT